MPVPVPPPPLAVSARVQRHAEHAIVRQINRVRRAHGLRSVRVDRQLAHVARAHSRAMLAHGLLTHDSFDGSSFGFRLRRARPRRLVGETLAWTPGRSAGAHAVVRLWMHSAVHRAVLMDGALHHVGVGRWLGSLGGHTGAAITADFTS